MRTQTRLRSTSGLTGMMAAAFAVVFCAQAVGADPWPQFGGPDRNFIVDSKGLADKWPDDGPKKIWTRELGDGYSTIVSDGKLLYTMYRIEEDEFTVALDAASGKTVWEHKYPSPFTELMKQFGPGPHTTPVIVGDKLYAIGTNAVMHCFDKSTGKVLWTIDLVEKFGAPIPGRGYGCSPIAYKNTIIVAVDRNRADEESDSEDDGKKEDAVEGQSVIAFNQEDGSVIWKSQDLPIAYASPILINFQGEEQLVMVMQQDVVGLSPADGKRLWHIAISPQGANLTSPVFNGKDLLYCSSAYDSGSRAIRLSREGGKTVAKQEWYSRKMRVHHANVIQLGDYVYGSSGDFGPAFFMAINIQTGKVAWRKRGFKKANCVYADGKMIILDEDGKLALATVSPEGLNVLSECTVAERYAWASPTLVGKTLYVRDRKIIMALDLN